jgi:hypothetical protein
MRPTVLLLVALAACGPSPTGGGQDLGATADLSSSINDCDVGLQDCPDPAQKCTLVDNPRPRAACVPVTGTKVESQACTATTFGNDDCDKGLLCAGLSAVCRALCSTAMARCSGMTACLGPVRVANSDVPGVGLCAPTCTPFPAQPGAGTCFGNETCGDLKDTIDGKKALGCRRTGATAVGAACSAQTDCVADAVCDAGTCRALCDATHACAAGSCTPLGTGPSGLGICK